MNKFSQLFLVAILSTVANLAIAAQGKWTEGFGQGNLEYFIDQDGLRLRIDCPTENGSADAASGIELSQINSGKEIKKFTIKVNGVNYEGPFITDSRVNDNNFISLLENLRKSDAFIKYEGKSIKLPKSNAQKLLPVFGKGFNCNLSEALIAGESGTNKHQSSASKSSNSTPQASTVTSANEAAQRAGICYAALLKSNKEGDYRNFSYVTIKYTNEVVSKCGSLTSVNKVCFENLSMPTRIFWNSGGQALKELSSPAPTTLLKNNPPGNAPITNGLLMMAYCN